MDYKKINTNLVIIIFLLTIFNSVVWAKTNQLLDYKVAQLPHGTRITLEFSNSIIYNLAKIPNNNTLVFNINNADFNKVISNKINKVKYEKTFINEVRMSKSIKKVISINFNLNCAIEPNVKLWPKTKQYGHRLIIDLRLPDNTAILNLFREKLIDNTIQPIRSNKPSPLKRAFIIAIDAGHGGHDPGAIGHFGTKEKDVTLAVAKILNQYINKEPNMKAVLLRTADYYLGLSERVALARKFKADLLISIHADAYHNTTTDGASVFTLSKRGATSVAAKLLAERENQADLIGDFGTKKDNQILASVLLDLTQTAAQSDSLEAANHILRSISRMMPIHRHKVEQAGFAVLKAHDVPSLLIEAGFITNPRMEMKLKDIKHQNKLAEAVLKGIKYHFNGKLPFIR